MARMTHPNLPDAVIDKAESAVPFYEASGWRRMSKKDSDAYDTRLREQARAAERAMSPNPDPEPASTKKSAKSDSDESASTRKSNTEENS